MLRTNLLHQSPKKYAEKKNTLLKDLKKLKIPVTSNDFIDSIITQKPPDKNKKRFQTKICPTPSTLKNLTFWDLLNRKAPKTKNSCTEFCLTRKIPWGFFFPPCKLKKNTQVIRGGPWPFCTSVPSAN